MTELGRLGAGHHGPPEQQGERPPTPACQAPSARSSTPAPPAARCKRALELGCGQGCPADQGGQHGVVLVRHRRRATAPSPRRARRPRGRPSTSTSLAIRPHASVQRHRRVAQPGHRRAGGVPGERLASPSWRAAAPTAGPARRRRPPSSTRAARVPAAPPSWTGRRRRRVVVRVQDAGQPPGGLEAEGGRYGVLGQGPRGHRRVRGAVARPASAPTWARSSVSSRGRRRPARSSISAVSSTSWLVSPRCSQRAASGRQPVPQHRHERDDRVAAVRRGRGQEGQVVGRHQARERVTGRPPLAPARY